MDNFKPGEENINNFNENIDSSLPKINNNIYNKNFMRINWYYYYIINI